MTARALVVSALLLLAACDGAGAPSDPGVCWRKTADGRFTPVGRDVDSLENCAVLLEGARLLGESHADGAYQGYYIFVDATRIASSARPSGYAYPIFQPPQRAVIDKDLMRLIKARGGQMPASEDIGVERK